MKNIITIFIFLHTLVFANVATLTSGKPISGIANKHTYNTYKMHAYAGQTVDISLYDMDADGDLYVSLDAPSSPMSAFVPIQISDILTFVPGGNRLSSWCQSRKVGKSNNEHCKITLVTDRDIYISVYAEKCINNVQYRLKATITEPNIKTLTSGSSLFGIANKYTYKHYKIHASAGDKIKVDLLNMDADGDLYVNIGKPALNTRYNCKSTTNSSQYTDTSDEHCEVTLQHDATVYIAVYAHKCINTVEHTIKATISDVPNGVYPPMDDGEYGISSGYGTWGGNTFTEDNEIDGDLKYTILKPNVAGKLPVIFFIGGYNVAYPAYSKLLEFIASKGNIVVYIDKEPIFNKNDFYIPVYNKIKQIVQHNNAIMDSNKMGLMGHSTGANVALWLGKKLYNDEHFGSQGRFISIFAPSYNWVTHTELASIPADTKFIIMQGQDDRAEDPRIAATFMSKATSINPSEKALIFVYSSNGYPANHSLSYTNSGHYNMLDALAINRTLDALMDYTFNGDSANANAKSTALLGRTSDAIIYRRQDNVTIGLRTIPRTGEYYQIKSSYHLKNAVSEKCTNVFNGGNEDDFLLDVCQHHVGNP